MRLVVARCQVDYAGRLTAHLPMATRVLMMKVDGSVLVHSDGGSYKPLNWMSPPCTVREGATDEGVVEWTVTGKDGDTLRILLEETSDPTLNPRQTVFQPELVIRAEFAGWTSDGMVRQAAYKGLDRGKDPRLVVREEPGVAR